MHFDPIKPKLKAPGTERLRLKYEELLSNFGLKCNLRRYIKASVHKPLVSKTTRVGTDGARPGTRGAGGALGSTQPTGGAGGRVRGAKQAEAGNHTVCSPHPPP
jgi:hypothetical protein